MKPRRPDPTTAQIVLRMATRAHVSDVDDFAMLWPHVYCEIETDVDPDAALAYAWVFLDGSVLYQPEWEDHAQILSPDGRICGPTDIVPRITVWPAAEGRILFQQAHPVRRCAAK